MSEATVQINFSAKGATKVVGAINVIKSHTKNTLAVLTQMQKTLNKMESKGLAGVNKELKVTQTATQKVASQFSLYRKELASAESQSTKYAEAVKKIGNQYGYMDKSMRKWLPELKKAEEYIRKKAAAMTVAGRNGQRYYDTMSRVAVMERMLNGTLSSTSRTFRQVRPTIESTTTALTRNGTATTTARRGIRNLIPHVAAVTLAYMAMRRAVNMATGAIKAGVDFENQMAHVGAIARATAEDFKILTEAAKKAGETTVWTATESAQALRFLSMAGFSAAESVESLLGVLNLALIGELDLGRATDIATDTLRAFGLEASELDRVVDVMVGTITRSNTNIEGMGQAMKFVAPVASKLGYTIEEVSAMIGILSQSGIKQGIAGRALRMSFLKSSSAAKKLGIESTNLMGVLKELNSRDLVPAELTDTLRDLFGIRSTPALLTLMQGTEQLEKFTETLKNAKGETKEYVDRLDTVQVAWDKLKSVMTDVAIEVFVGNAKDLKNALKELTQIIKDNKDEIKDWINIIKSATEGGVNIIKLFLLPLQATALIINKAGDLVGIANAFERIAKSGTMAVFPITGMSEAIKKGWSHYMKFLEWESDIWTGETKLKTAVKEANAVYAKRLALMAEQAKMEDEYNGIAEAVGSIAFAVKQWGEEQSKIRDIVAQIYKESDWWDLLSFDEQGTPEIQRLQAIANFRKKLTQELKKENGVYYDEDAKAWQDLIAHKVAGFTEQYDANISFTENSLKLDTEHTEKMAELLDQFTNEEYKNFVLKQTELYQQSQMDKLDATKAGSKEAFEVIKNTYKEEEAITKEYLKNQKDVEKDLAAFRKEVYKDDTAAQIIAVLEKFENIKKVFGDTVELEELQQTIISAIRKKGEEAEAKARRAIEQKFADSLAVSAGVREIAFNLRIEGKEEFENFMSEINTSLGDQSDLFESSIFGDAASQNIQNVASTLEKMSGMYGKIVEREEEIIELRKEAGSYTGEERVKALEAVSKKETKYAQESIEAQLSGYRQLFSSTKMLFEENSSARKTMHYAEMAFATAEIAIQAQKNLMIAVGAVAKQGADGDPYTAFERVAAMISVMAGVLAIVGIGFSASGGSGGGGGSAPVLPPSTVLGADPGTASESISNAFDMLEDQNAEQYAALINIYNEIQQLNKNITGLVTAVIKSGGGTFTDGTTNFKSELVNSFDDAMNIFVGLFKKIPIVGEITHLLGAILGGIGRKVLGKIFGGGGWHDIWGGVKPGAMSIGNLVAGQTLAGQTYIGHHKHTEGGWFSSDKEKWWTEYQAMGEDLNRLFTNIFANIANSAVMLGEGLGADMDKVLAYVLDIGEVQLSGLSPEEIDAKLTAVFSNLTDTMAGELFGDIIKQYQQVDEGLYETAVRLVMEKEIFLDVLNLTGQAFNGTAREAVDLSQAVITLAGDIETLTEDATAYFDNFLTKGEKHAHLLNSMSGMFDNLEISMPATRQGFKDLMESIDITTESGQELYVALLSISEAMGQYYDEIEEATETLLNLDRRLSETDLEATIRGIIEDFEEGYAALAVLYGLDSNNRAGIDSEIKEKRNDYQDEIASLEKDIQYLDDTMGLLKAIVDDPTNKETQKLLVQHFQDLFDSVAEIADPKELAKGLHDFALDDQLTDGIIYLGTALKALTELDGGGLTDFIDELTAFIQSMANFSYFETNNFQEGAWDVEETALAFTNMMDDLDSMLESVDRELAQHSGNNQVTDVLKSVKVYLKGLKDVMSFFEDAMGDDLTSASVKEKLQNILADLGKNDFDSAITYLKNQISLLEDEGPSEALTKTKDALQALEEAAAAFHKYELEQLDLIKIELGLMTTAEYRNKKLAAIQARYAFTGMSSEQLIKAFGNMNLDDLKKVAKDLGIEWTDIAQDMAFLVELEHELYNIRKAQAELSGKDIGLWEIAERYKIDYNKIDKDFAKNIIDQFLAMTAEQVRAWADSLGVSTEQLVADIMTLANTFDTLGTNLATLRKQIEEMLSSISSTFNGPESAAMIMTQIKDLQDIPMEKQTGENLLSMSEKLVQWYNAAVAEAQKAAQEEAEAARLLIQVADRVKSLISQIESTISNIKYSNLSVVLPPEKAEDAAQDYAKLLAAAQTGGTAEINEYLGFAQTYLQQQQDAYKSSETYQGVYASVMADLEAIKAKAEAGGYDEQILAELQRGNAEVEVDLTAIQAQFSEIEGWIMDALDTLEHLQLILTIDWGEYDGTIAETLQMLVDIVETYGWDNTITLNWISNMAAWAAQDVERAIIIMDDIAAKSGGWTSNASITFVAAVAANLLNLTDAMAVLEHLVSETGDWNSEVVIQFLEGILANSNLNSFNNAYAVLQYMANNGVAWDDEVMIRFMASWAANGVLTNYADAKAVLIYMLNNGATWDDEVMITFVAQAASVISSYSDATEMLDYLLANAGGWTGLATISFLASVNTESFMTTTDRIAALANIAMASGGWGTTATMAFMANISDDGDMTWAEIDEYLTAMEVDPLIIATLKMQYDVANSAWSSWEAFETFLDTLDIEPTVLAKIQTIYEATGSTWSSWTAVETALAELDLDPTILATIKAQWATDNQWANWDAVKAMLDQLEIDPTVSAEIKAAYDAAGSDLTLSNFEKMLTSAGLTAGEILTIKNQLSGAVEVELVEMDFWTAAIGLLTWIAENTGEIAKQLGAPYADFSKFLQFAPGVFNWAGEFSGGLGRQSATGIALPVGGGSGTSTFPAGVGVYNGALKIAAIEFGIPKEAWTTTGLKVDTGYNTYLYHIYNRLHDLGTVTVSGSGGGGLTTTESSYLTKIKDNTWGIWCDTWDIKANAINIYNRMHDLRIGGTVAVTGSSGGGGLTSTESLYLTQIKDYAFNIRRNQQNQNAHWLNVDFGNRVIPYYGDGGISWHDEMARVGEKGPEAHIPLKNMAIPVTFTNGGSTQAGASDEEIQLLKELIDTLHAKDTSPTVNINVDTQGIIKEAGEYVSEKSRRGTLDMRAH